MNELAGLPQDLFKENIDIFCCGQLDPEVDDGRQLLLFAQHGQYYLSTPGLSINDSGSPGMDLSIDSCRLF